MVARWTARSEPPHGIVIRDENGAQICTCPPSGGDAETIARMPEIIERLGLLVDALVNEGFGVEGENDDLEEKFRAARDLVLELRARDEIAAEEAPTPRAKTGEPEG